MDESSDQYESGKLRQWITTLIGKCCKRFGNEVVKGDNDGS